MLPEGLLKEGPAALHAGPDGPRRDAAPGVVEGLEGGRIALVTKNYDDRLCTRGQSYVYHVP